MRDTLRALRLYVSPVLSRENPALLCGGMYVLLLGAQMIGHHHGSLRHGDHVTMPRDMGIWWWLTQQMIFNALAHQYWRQVRSPLAAFYPRLVMAEHRAALVALAVAVSAFALPLALLGAPLLNVVALEAIALPLSLRSDIATPKALRGRIRWVPTVLSLGASLVFLLPSMQDRVLSAPWYAALILLATGLTLGVFELRPPSGQAPPEPAAPARRAEPDISRAARQSSPVLRILLWQPPWLRVAPVPQAFDQTSPGMTVMTSVVMSGVFMVIVAVTIMLSKGHLPSWKEIASGIDSVPRLLCMMAGFGFSQWLTLRRDWPFLLTLGPFGDRAAFARRMYRVHFLRAVQGSVLSVLLAGSIACGIGLISLHRLVLAAPGLICVMMGVAYVPSLAVFHARLARPALIQFLVTMSAAFGIQILAEIFLGRHPVPLWAWGVAAAAVPFSALVAWRAPGALARADWPLEPPPL
ncbi:hypothetical protein [Acidomonas methanolica]|uniref:hypothetical protein n=1 Tax=Acidomonas methanolica TaxID=437 RepID=UPI00211A9290|nr:hypothetical protein [Acidomonas methanolica]MCQ9156232.1 hypothetical protein [Acidomonas methanolica]